MQYRQTCNVQLTSTLNVFQEVFLVMVACKCYYTKIKEIPQAKVLLGEGGRKHSVVFCYVVSGLAHQQCIGTVKDRGFGAL